jgi:hypothetical protein
LTAGKVRLSLVVPRTSKGKTLRIRITISTVAGAVHHSYTYAIR